MARPSKYNYKLCVEVCNKVMEGSNIKAVLKSNDKYPSFPTWCKWKRENEELLNLYYSIPRMSKFRNRRWDNKEYKTKGKFDKNKYYRIKRTENPAERIRYSISSSIYQRIKRNKKGSVLNSLPYTIDNLKTHLENQFKEGMSWDNYGEWHIDHIKPHSLFNYNSMECEEFRECWGLNNLQPLWATDNIKKSNSYGCT